MKKIMKIAVVALLAFSATAMVSCKDKDAAIETETTETDTSSAAPDTTAVQDAPINDSNVSGTTSGDMEQVP